LTIFSVSFIANGNLATVIAANIVTVFAREHKGGFQPPLLFFLFFCGGNACRRVVVSNCLVSKILRFTQNDGLLVVPIGENVIALWQ
jgi:hypothetical protein